MIYLPALLFNSVERIQKHFPFHEVINHTVIPWDCLKPEDFCIKVRLKDLEGNLFTVVRSSHILDYKKETEK